jgi:hypothetical protein
VLVVGDNINDESKDRGDTEGFDSSLAKVFSSEALNDAFSSGLLTDKPWLI